ncbi:hypothetical protein N2152v2_008996 [Parachlorella kessleri]
MSGTPPGGSTNPFASSNPFGPTSPVQTTYQPPAVSNGAWGSTRPQHELDEDVEPFTVAHLSAGQDETSTPQGDLTGRIGPASPVPRVGSAPDTTLLLGSQPRSTSPGPAPVAAPQPPEEDPTKFAFYNIKRYRTFFNVDTTEVLQRIFWSIILFFKSDFLDNISSNPDLYGPFWVATTLIFVSAATGNYASYIEYNRHHPAGSEDVKGWYYDAKKVGGSAGLFYGYVGVVGLVLFFVLRWFKAGISLASVWCTYGYALAVFIPISFVCIFPVEIMRWSVIAAATFVSGMFIMLNFRRPVFDHVGAKALPVYLVMAGLHLGLGLALKLYFFHYSDVSS